MGKDVRRDIANRDLGRALGRKIARLERHVRELETASQAAFRSVEDGSIDIYDDNGVLRERIGKQTDGSWGRVVKEGPIPPAPTEPDVQVISDGVVAITWDGRTEEPWPTSEFRMVRVHLDDTADFVCDRNNQVGAIHAQRGGTIVAVTESDDDNPVWVKLAAVSTAGHWTSSAAVLVDELDELDLEEEQEEIEWEDGDGHTLTADDITAGTVTFGLSHTPEEESLTAWLGIPQPKSEFTVDYEARTLTWELDGFEQEGDRISVHYAHRDVTDAIVPYGASGWSYLIVAAGDAADYSASGFDDSTWTVGSAAFGHEYGGPIGPGLVPATDWPDGDIWIRRTFPAAHAVQVAVKVEDNAEIWVNGSLLADMAPVGSGSSYVDPEVVFDVPDSMLTPGGDNVIAVRGRDDIAGTSDHTYLDIEVRGVLE